MSRYDDLRRSALRGGRRGRRRERPEERPDVDGGGDLLEPEAPTITREMISDPEAFNRADLGMRRAMLSDPGVNQAMQATWSEQVNGREVDPSQAVIRGRADVDEENGFGNYEYTPGLNTGTTTQNRMAINPTFRGKVPINGIDFNKMRADPLGRPENWLTPQARRQWDEQDAFERAKAGDKRAARQFLKSARIRRYMGG